MIKVPNPTSYKPQKLCSGYGPNGPGPGGRRPVVPNPEDLTAFKDAPHRSPNLGGRRNPSTTHVHDDKPLVNGSRGGDNRFDPTRIHDDKVFMQGPDCFDRSRVHDDSVFMQVPDISKMFGG